MTANRALERTQGYREPRADCEQVVGWLCVRQAAAGPAAQPGSQALHV